MDHPSPPNSDFLTSLNSRWLTPFLSNAFIKTIRSPLDVAKIRYVCNPELLHSGKAIKMYSSPWDILVNLWSEEGPEAYWKGNIANLLLFLPSRLANLILADFTKKEKKKLLAPRENNQNHLYYLCKGVVMTGLGNIVGATLNYSLEFAKIKLINDIGDKEFNGILDVYRKTISSSGFLSMYRGFGLTIFGMMVYRFLYFSLFDFFEKLQPERHRRNKMLGFLISVLIIAVSGVLTYPFDVLRKRMIMATGDEVGRGVTDWVVHILKNEGIRGLFRGCSFNVFEGVFLGLVTMLYEGK